MSRLRFVALVVEVWWRLASYDLANKTRGFEFIYKAVARYPVRKGRHDPHVQASVCDAVAVATCFYWKPVLCLQRAFVTTLLLKAHSVSARLVIGYRPSPFFSHAWVEVDDQVVGDSPAYRERLKILCSV